MDGLYTEEELRVAVAKWLLKNDIKLICCEGNYLGDEFLANYKLPPLKEELFNVYVDSRERITMVMRSTIKLNPKQAVRGKACTFTVMRHVRALYDDVGYVYKYVTLGYNF